MFGYYLRRVDQRCSPCEFEKNDSVISDICDIPWLTLAYFGLLRVSLTSPPFILPRVFTTISEFNPNVPNVPVSCMSQDGVRDAAVSCNSTVRYSAYVCDLCVFTRCTLHLYFWFWEISSLPGCLLLVGLCCSCCQLQEKWSHVSTEGPLISHHPTGRSLWTELF